MLSGTHVGAHKGGPHTRCEGADMASGAQKGAPGHSLWGTEWLRTVFSGSNRVVPRGSFWCTQWVQEHSF